MIATVRITPYQILEKLKIIAEFKEN